MMAIFASTSYQLRAEDLKSREEWSRYETREWYRAWRFRNLSLESMDASDAAAVRAFANVINPPAFIA